MQKINSTIAHYLTICSVLLTCSSCLSKIHPVTGAVNDYLPTTIGSFWNYTGDVIESKKITGATKKFNGSVYHEGETTYDGKTTKGYIRKENGIYYSRGFLGAAGDTLELIILKDNLPSGTTWNSILPNALGPIDYKFTIEEKGLSLSIIDKIYKDVIKVKMEVSFRVKDGLRRITTEYIYFAPGTGIIQFETISSKGVVKYSKLNTYLVR